MPAADRANVAALIPCYFEEKHIRDVATRARAQLDTVLVVDDGSTDRTSDEARAAGVTVVKHERNAGKGAAIKTGLRELASSGVPWIVILDGDGQHPPEEIPHFIAAANETGAELIVGNRMGDTRTMPLVRKLTNLSMSWLISRVAGQTIPDTQCGFRMFSRELAEAFIEVPTTGFDFESEMLVLAARRGVRIGAAPVSTVYGDEVSKIRPVHDTLRFLKLLARMRG
ncbi:MAG: glycosyltransferase family 2 protein [Chthoniobacteraceae bacterium]